MAAEDVDAFKEWSPIAEKSAQALVDALNTSLPIEVRMEARARYILLNRQLEALWAKYDSEGNAIDK